MRIIEQQFSLSDDDLGLLAGTKILEAMLKQRLIVEFDETPNIEEIDLNQIAAIAFMTPKINI